MCCLGLQSRRGHEPLSAEAKYALSVRLVGPTIAGKRVQGPVVVGDLLTARSGDDAKPGDTNGEGSTAFGAGWDVLAPTGEKIEKSASSGSY